MDRPADTNPNTGPTTARLARRTMYDTPAIERECRALDALCTISAVLDAVLQPVQRVWSPPDETWRSRSFPADSSEASGDDIPPSAPLGHRIVSPHRPCSTLLQPNRHDTRSRARVLARLKTVVRGRTTYEEPPPWPGDSVHVGYQATTSIEARLGANSRNSEARPSAARIKQALVTLVEGYEAAGRARFISERRRPDRPGCRLQATRRPGSPGRQNPRGSRRSGPPRASRGKGRSRTNRRSYRGRLRHRRP